MGVRRGREAFGVESGDGARDGGTARRHADAAVMSARSRTHARHLVSVDLRNGFSMTCVTESQRGSASSFSACRVG
eukprot:CAMPEP_0203827432 /NCGR_PEP_ID=MMETSP0115-20131106/58952_1 /ASSEMBLY_ACC=CAM_ASM_000227 /TAXON_ID=33651 /ORGANISM="Bicosoecid sp, Strain ms1" /LENGTH=75 /DNA_ID=CAMNT_0050736491 /DNA_START=253 /DNA_END=478 /DNA_ORIENTATION=+